MLHVIKSIFDGIVPTIDPTHFVSWSFLLIGMVTTDSIDVTSEAVFHGTRQQEVE